MREAAHRSHKGAAFHQMPQWLLDRIQEVRQAAGLPRLNVTGIPNDSKRFSVEQRATNRRMVAKYERETAVARVKRLGKAVRRMRNHS